MGNLNRTKNKRKRDYMNGETAIAFAIECFQRLHPKESCPEWLSRCTTFSQNWDEDDNYIVYFSITPKATNKGMDYFKVKVNPMTANTEVLLDNGWHEYAGSDMQGY